MHSLIQKSEHPRPWQVKKQRQRFEKYPGAIHFEYSWKSTLPSPLASKRSTNSVICNRTSTTT